MRSVDMPATLADVARRAGVSEATASRALNGRRYVAAATRARVDEAVQSLDYVPNRAARDLSLSKTATVALLVHHRQYPAGGEGTFGSRVLHGVARALRAAGHDLLYVTADDEAVDSLSRLPALRPGRSDGAILLGPAFPHHAVDALRARRPTVLVDNLHDDTDAVAADNRPAVEALTIHLLADHGYRDVACIAGPDDWPSTAERVAGYTTAMEAAGLPTRVVHAAETTMRDGASATATLLAGERVQAIVAVNDAMAIGAIHQLRAHADGPATAVVGFDDIAWAELTVPPLTTIAVNAVEMGARAAELLLQRIAQPLAPPRVVRITATPRIRRSCGCPAADAIRDHEDRSSPGIPGGDGIHV